MDNTLETPKYRFITKIGESGQTFYKLRTPPRIPPLGYWRSEQEAVDAYENYCKIHGLKP